MIEAKLIDPLVEVLSPRSVAGMKPELVTHIAGESEENRMEREQLRLQLDILSKGLNTCKHFIGMGGLGKVLDLFLLEIFNTFIVTSIPVHQTKSSHDFIYEAEEISIGEF